jgi:hypothetical protein
MLYKSFKDVHVVGYAVHHECGYIGPIYGKRELVPLTPCALCGSSKTHVLPITRSKTHYLLKAWLSELEEE